MKAAALLILLLLSIAGYSQNSINAYKYVIVPIQFDFSKIVNQYGVNTTTKRLLEEKGFVVVFENETMPPEIIANRCNALKADVTEGKGFLVTKLTLLLKDCTGNVVFKSKDGKSREKDYAAAYDGALRDAFTSLNTLAYKYDSTLAKSQFAAIPATQQPAPASSTAGAVTTPASAAPPVSTPTQPALSQAPAAPVATASSEALYAQTTTNGYQLVNTEPKKVLTLLKTSVPDYFIAQSETASGIVFKKDGEWFFEYYKEDKLVSKTLKIKF